MKTQDNTLWQYQKFFRKKLSDIPSLNGAAITDEEKANLLVATFQNNFTDNFSEYDGVYGSNCNRWPLLVRMKRLTIKDQLIAVPTLEHAPRFNCICPFATDSKFLQTSITLQRIPSTFH
ncbi:hypothetical protein TNCV_2695251 [Trichonephila clavipes]|nr:hypothetical protein TNCV_2695251 [Trichonephila clavipes]